MIKKKFASFYQFEGKDGREETWEGLEGEKEKGKVIYFN